MLISDHDAALCRDATGLRALVRVPAEALSGEPDTSASLCVSNPPRLPKGPLIALSCSSDRQPGSQS